MMHPGLLLPWMLPGPLLLIEQCALDVTIELSWGLSFGKVVPN